MNKRKLALSDLRVESFPTASRTLVNAAAMSESFTGEYGRRCVSLPPNCLQSAIKCV